MTDDGPPVLAVVGATATGKSDLGLAVAQAVGGEVVNADAMQLYVGMDVGTAKLPPAERRGIPHHLLDVWPVSRRASVADYQALAIAAVEEIRGRGSTPVVVGGSGLYLRALLDDLHIPPTDAGTRAALEERLAAVGPKALHAELAAADPAAAQAILPTNGRRVVRALEVVALTGSYSASLPAGRFRWRTVGVLLEAPDLAARIERRVTAMFDAGLVAEVTRLAAAGLRDAPTAAHALGYKQVLEHPDDPVTAAAATVVATRQYARRQRSWFRRERRFLRSDRPAEALSHLVAAARH